jgi:hypothetical protein
MDEDIDNSLVGYLSIITDPRIERGRRHNLIDIGNSRVCGYLRS